MKACKPSVEFLDRRDVPAIVMPVAYVESAPPPPVVVLPPAVPAYQPPPQTLIPNIFDIDEPEQLLPPYPNPPQLTPQLPTGPDYTFPPFQYPIPGQATPPAVPFGSPQPIPGVLTPPAAP